MTLTGFFVLTFNSTHHAIHTEKLLKEAGLKIEMIPTPREISSSCGLSIKFPVDMLDKVKKVTSINKPVMKLYREIKHATGIVYLEEGR